MKKLTIVSWSLLATVAFLPLACSGDDDEAPMNTGGNAGSAGKGGSGGTAGKGGTSGSASKDGGAAGIGPLGGAGGGGGEAGAGGRKPLGKPPTCTSPKLDDFGITTCQEGYHYREKPAACAFRADQGADAGGAGGASSGGAGGSADAAESSAPQCFPACEGEHAYCHTISATPFQAVCTRGCLTDDECGDNELCQCDGARGGVCVTASCRGDADCDDGYHCAQAEICTRLNTGSFACQTPEDECVTQEDCPHAACGLNLADESHRVCYEGLSCG